MTTQVDTQTHADQRTDSVTAEAGSEDEAIQAFNQRRQSQAQIEPDAPTDEPQDDADSQEADEADPEEVAELAEELVEVEFEGEKYELPPKLKDALLRKADYSRQSQAVAEAKKDYAQRIESATKLIEGAEKFAEVIAEGKTLDAQIKSYETVDWTTLERDDPARASLLAVKFLQLQQARAQIDSKAQAIERDIADGRTKDQAAKQAEMLKVLVKDFPGWGEAAGELVTKYALKSGYSAQEIGQISDPRLVLALEKARKFDAIQDGKRNAIAQTRGVQPVAKPGAPRRAAPAADAMARFQKSNTPDDAVAAFMAQAASKRR